MPRKISDDFPPCPIRPANAKAYPDDSYETLELDIQVVTPMFGGGSEAGVPDPVTLIRPSSIRGHLRFWWRATRGAAFTTVRDLKQRETEIFGDTEHPSPVIVEVQSPEWEHRREAPEYGFSKFGAEAYALFSAKQNEKHLSKEGLTFQLRIRWPKHVELQRWRDRENELRRRNHRELLPIVVDDITEEVRAAIAAWLNFGGLGARTRRGCGSLISISPSIFAAAMSCKPIPGSRLFIGAPSSGPLDAWAIAVSVYREFRQKQRGKKTRNGQQVPEARSFWPEPDSIRQLTNCSKPNHSTPVVDEQFIGSFPRAALGMPIIFWFKDGPGKDSRKRPLPPDKSKDPCDAELVPHVLNADGKLVAGTRMASPVITRAISIDGKWHPAILALPRSGVDKLQGLLKVRGLMNGQVEAIEHPINAGQIQGSQFGALKTMRGASSAIDALLAFAQETPRGFREVQP